MKIVFVGDLRHGRTGQHRFAAAQRLGHDVVGLDTSARADTALNRAATRVALRLGRHLDLVGLSTMLVDTVRSCRPAVVWLDKVLSINSAALEEVRNNLRAKIVFYHPDDFRSRFNWSELYNQSAELFDLVVTTKSYNVPEYLEHGFRRVKFVNNSFEPTEHRPPVGADLSRPRTSFSCDVGFIGGYELERASMIAALARRGVPVSVRGSFWERATDLPPLVQVIPGDLAAPYYANSFYETKINLAFLRKVNRDLQTTRSVEIPASGGFMLSERTDELEGLLRPGVEAEYFASLDELEAKCRYYLANDAERETIATAGRQRVWAAALRTDDMVADVLASVI